MEEHNHWNRLRHTQKQYHAGTLEAVHISKSYGDNQVLSDVSLTLTEGHVSVLMGTNGAGKTTLLNILSGFVKPDGGNVLLNGRSIDGVQPELLNQMGMVRTFQDMRLIGGMSVIENVMLAFPRQAGEKWWKTLLPNKRVAEEQRENLQKAKDIIQTCFIEDVADHKASEISFGQQKLLNMACCMASGTSVWLLDEPVAGVNPAYREKLADIIRQQKHMGKSLLIIEHNSDFIADVTDEVLFLYGGKIQLFPSFEAFMNNDDVRNAYV